MIIGVNTSEMKALKIVLEDAIEPLPTILDDFLVWVDFLNSEVVLLMKHNRDTLLFY